MYRPISAARWAAIRALSEGQPPTFPLLAAATAVHPVTLREHSSREGWNKPDFRTRASRESWAGRTASCAGPSSIADPPQGWEDMAPEQRLEWLNDFVARQVTQIATSAEGEGGTLDKTRIDALAAMLRMLEKSETFARERTEIRVHDDAELAEKLRLIDERIVELATALAGRMGGEADRAELG